MREAACILAAVVCCAALAAAQVPESHAGTPGPQDAFGRKLVAVATISPRDYRGLVALKQLRRLAHEGEVSGAVLKPLTGYAAYTGPFDWLVWEALAAGGEPVEMSCLHALERRPDDPVSMIVLATIEVPSKAATARLATLRPSRRASWFSRTAYALCMSVRGDRSEDWTAQLVDAILHPADPLHFPGYDLFMELLALVAPRLERSPELEAALWRSLGDESNECRVSAVVPLLALASRPLSASQAELLQRAVRNGGLKDSMEPAFLVHLVLARMGVHTELEMERALSEIGSMSAEYRFAVSVFETPYVGMFMDPKLTGLLEEALWNGSREVKLGALALASAMGPDAAGMLPAIERLVSDQDREVARDARKARVLVAGLNEEGEWVHKEDARVLELAYPWEDTWPGASDSAPLAPH